MKSFYITTTLPYVNSDPHVGFAMEIIRADVIARHKKLEGYEVFFNTGTDEHGLKLYQAAEKEGIPVQEYVDRYAEKFKGLVTLLGITPEVHFIRTTDTHHQSSAQEFWKRCTDRGFIYKKNYEAKYCIGCELEKTDSELNEEGRCPIHPDKSIELIQEENYFFAYSKLESALKELYAANPSLVIPDFRFNEMKAFLERGLQDFSISRLKEKMPWGIAVPGDQSHVMYVWFDALVNYISTLGWPENKEQFEKFWEHGTPVQYCGKDNVRQQSSMWQAMLLAADLPPTHHIVINGFINSAGQKMSKSLGNVINPYDVVEQFKPAAKELAGDVLRYYLLRHMNSFEDSDMTLAGVHEAYEAHLANGLGNLVSRVMTLAEKHSELQLLEPHTATATYNAALENFDLQQGMNIIWAEISELDKWIQNERPFSVIKENEQEGKRLIIQSVKRLANIAEMLVPFLPQTAQAIKQLIAENKKPSTPLFARLEK